MPPTVSVIIVAYQSAPHLAACLEAVTQQDTPHEVIVIDNASTDGTAALIHTRFPTVNLSVNAQNLGFAAAANRGAARAHEPYLLFLNPDAILGPSALPALAAALDRSERLGAVGCQTRNPNGSIQSSVGCFPTLANLIINRTPILKRLVPSYGICRPAYYRQPQTPDWLSGACLLVRQQAFAAVGGFDEKFFLYGEDVDLCYRLRHAGWHIAYTPNAHVIHADVGKTAERKMGKFLNLRRGLLRFYRKHYPPAALARLQRALRLEARLRLHVTTAPERRQTYRRWLDELTHVP